MEEKKLSRREVLKKIAVGSAVLGAGAAALSSCKNKGQEISAPAVHTGKKIKWKMVTTWPKNFPGLGTGANNLAKMIKEMSSGRLEIKVYGAGELVPAFGVFDAVSSGTAQMGHAAPYYWKGKHSAAQFFGAVPFGLTTQEINGWFYYGDGQKLWDELYADFGLKAFPAGNTGVQMGGWFKKEINSSADFKGLKMRIPGLGGEVLKQLGATVVNIPGGELFQALQSGAIDATEWVGPYNDLAFGLHNAAKLYYWPGWHEPCAAIECSMNKKAYDALPEDLKEVVRVACQAANMDMLAEKMARNASSLRELVSNHDVKLKKFPDEVLKKLGEVSKDVLEKVASENAFTRKVHDNYMAFRKDQLAWDKVSEGGYSVARSLTFS
jgi:TRAP-type mannitol/chloroaromatic compound transport system substrate-binding protein